MEFEQITDGSDKIAVIENSSYARHRWHETMTIELFLDAVRCRYLQILSRSSYVLSHMARRKLTIEV